MKLLANEDNLRIGRYLLLKKDVYITLSLFISNVEQQFNISSTSTTSENKLGCHSLGAICVLPASIVICVGMFSDFALSCMSNKKWLDRKDIKYGCLLGRATIG